MENGNWSQLINTKDCGRNKNQNGKQQFAGKTKQISDTIWTSFWGKQEHPSKRSHRDRPKQDKIKYKNGHHKKGKIEDDQQKMDEKENMNTIWTPWTMKWVSDQEEMWNKEQFQMNTKELPKDDYDLLDTPY